MKIGLITFHRAQNIGANLQAYALNKFINDNICLCELIDYYPNNQAAHKNRFRKFLSKVKGYVFFRKSSTRNNFIAFQKANYVLNPKTYYGDDNIKNSYIEDEYDVLISGSDQILNTTLSGDSTSYYLSFANNTPKISYASSFGRDVLTETEYILINTELSKFDFVSVREASAAKIIEKELGKKCQLVLDPVFLLDKDIWGSVASVTKKIPFNKYIFVYIMEQSNALEEAVFELQKLTRLPVVVVKGCEKYNAPCDIEDKCCGPAEFLRYVSDAEYIVTNSFHGTAMSLVYGKKFISVAHSSRNARLKNIMDLLFAGQKLVPFASLKEKISYYINDGSSLYKLLNKHIDASKQYLISALNYYNK